MQVSRLHSLHLAAWSIFVFSISSTALGQEQEYQSGFPTRQMKTTDNTTPAMRYFGGSLRKRTRRQSIGRELPAPQPVHIAGSKPFQTLQRGATLSPYLGLDIRTSELSIPNYYAFVRPQQQLQNSNRDQSAQVRRLKQKLRVATSQGIVSNNPSGGVPTTGQSSQFLNMGSYFPAPR